MLIEIENANFENNQQPLKNLWQEFEKENQHLDEAQKDATFYSYYLKKRENRDEEIQVPEEKTQVLNVDLGGKSDDRVKNINQPENSYNKEGKIELEETYKYFNQHYNYVEKHGVRQAVTNFINRKEAVFENKEDQSKIHVYKNRLKIDPTPTNIQASLDLAKDKGWTTIRITGGSKENRAQLWLQAQLQGFDTRGYKPTKADIKLLRGALERQQEQQAEQTQNMVQEDLEINPKPEALEQKEEITPTQEQPKSQVNQSETLSPIEQLIEKETKEIINETKKSFEKPEQKEEITPTQEQPKAQVNQSETLSPIEQLIEKETKEIMGIYLKSAINIPLDEIKKVEQKIKKQMATVAQQKGEKALHKFISETKKSFEKPEQKEEITPTQEEPKAQVNQSETLSPIEQLIEKETKEIMGVYLKSAINIPLDEIKKVEQKIKKQMATVAQQKGEKALKNFIDKTKQGMPILAQKLQQTAHKEQQQAKQQQRQKENIQIR